MNVTKPLKRGKMLSLAEGGKVLAMFRYERLPDFCYVCGCLDHQELDCDKVIQSKKRGRKIQREYGNWMKAENPGSMLSTRICFDPSIRSMKSGDNITRDRNARRLENTGGPVEQGKSKLSEGSSQSWRSEVQQWEGKEIMEVVDESETGDTHVINGMHQLQSGKGVEIKGNRMDSKNGGTDNKLPYMNINEGEKLTQSNNEVEDLTEGIDKVEIFCFGNKGGEKDSVVQNLVAVPIQNESTQMVKSKGVVTWKRAKRSMPKGNLKGSNGSGSRVKRRQHTVDFEMQGMKKQKDVQLEHGQVVVSSEAVVGIVQPRLEL